jgi:hypothetical protein
MKIKKNKLIYKSIVGEKRQWTLNGKLHRENGPACIWPSGTKTWFINGKRHRLNGPAIEWSDGSKEWYIDSQRHREDGPAVEWSAGYKEWFLNDKWYEENDYWKELFKRGLISEKDLFLKLL